MITEEQYERSKKRVRRKLKVMTAIRILTNPPFYYKGTNRFRLIKQCFDEIDKLFDNHVRIQQQRGIKYGKFRSTQKSSTEI